MNMQLQANTKTYHPKNKPVTVEVDWDGIPTDLRQRRLWVCWRPEEVTGKDGLIKLSKVPYTCRDGGVKASTTAPETWDTYEAAKTACEMFPDSFRGPGLIMRDGLVGIDLDHCRDPQSGRIEEWAWEIIRALNSYTELSPSGSGVKILAYSKMASVAEALHVNVKDLGNRVPYASGEVEVYDHNSPRYFTVTGQRVEGTREYIMPRQDEFLSVYKAVFASKINAARDRTTKRLKAQTTFRESNPDNLVVEDQTIVELALSAANGEKFRALFEGRWEEVKDIDGKSYQSQSSADLALCLLLAFYTGPDSEDQIERIFRASGLFRDEKDRPTYINATIHNALNHVIDRGEFFCWDYRKIAKRKDEQTEILLRVCRDRGLVPIAKPANEVEILPMPEPAIDLKAHSNDPMYAFLWEGNHGLFVTDPERRRRINSIKKCRSLVPNGGFFDAYLRTFTKASDMNCLYNIAGALSLAGHIMNRKVYTWMGTQRMCCHLWNGIIGPSTVGRKTQALTNMVTALNLLDDYAEAVAPSNFSMSTLLDTFGTPIPKPEKKGDPLPSPSDVYLEMKSRMLASMENPDNDYLAGVAVFTVDEIATFLAEIMKVSNSGAMDALMAWYGSPERYPTAKYRTAANVVISRPCPSILGCSTPENMAGHLSTASLESGFLPRWLLFPTWSDEKDLDLSHPDTVTEEEVGNLLPYLQHFRRCRGERKPTVEASYLYDTWYRSVIGNKSTELYSWVARMVGSVWKVAMIYQADMNPDDPQNELITKEALELAICLMDELIERLTRLWPDFSFSEDERQVTRVFRMIESAGPRGIEHTPLLTRLKGKSSTWKPCIDSLVDQGRITVKTRDSATKSAAVYVATRYGDEITNLGLEI